MPRNVEAILNWTRLYRPDLVEGMEAVIAQANDGIILIMTVAFEAGRVFQANEVADPAIYVPMQEIY
jgi:hypothetical protein